MKGGPEFGASLGELLPFYRNLGRRPLLLLNTQTAKRLPYPDPMAMLHAILCQCILHRSEHLLKSLCVKSWLQIAFPFLSQICDVGGVTPGAKRLARSASREARLRQDHSHDR